MTIASKTISFQTGTFVSLEPVIQAAVIAGFGSVFAWYVSNQSTFDSSAIYSGVFDILSIFTGFLATFYVFVITKGNKFLEKIKETVTYKMVLKLLKFTILWSAAMIAFSYVLMILKPENYTLFSVTHLVVFFWIANISLIALNFRRCVIQFSTIISAGN